jgi:hypothetical protein
MVSGLIFSWRIWPYFRLASTAIMDRIVHNTIWVDTGNHNMREHATMTQ